MSQPSPAALPSRSPSPTPIQPTAAALAPELLGIIFKWTELFVEPEKQQWQRLKVGEVCRAWYAARVKRNELLVEEEQAPKLLRALRADPLRGERVTKIAIRWADQHWASILGLCPNAGEVSLTSSYNEDVDCLRSLPAGLRTLRLSLNMGGDTDWLPDLSHISSTVEIELRMHWKSEVRPEDTRAVLDALSVVASQVTRLTALDVEPKYEPDARGYLFPAILKMTHLEELELSFWQVKAEDLVTLVGRMGALEQLRLVDIGGDFNYELTPELIERILDKAQPNFKTLWIDSAILNWYPQSLWTEEKRAALSEAARKMGREVVWAHKPQRVDEAYRNFWMIHRSA